MSILAKVLSVVCLSFVSATVSAGFVPGKPVSAQQRSFSIRVVEGGWGDGNVEDIEKVLYSAADEILASRTNNTQISIIIEHNEDGPRTLYRRGDKGEFIVWLDTEGRRWAQYAYQFSHELIHVLTMNSSLERSPNQWFEESLGEAASLFALRRMAKTWEDQPPYLNWKAYAKHLNEYAEGEMKEAHRQLPARTTLLEWFRENEASLRRDPYLRDKNALIANQLLPLFEDSPHGWEAVAYVNLSRLEGSQTFEQYLNDWHQRAPGKHRQFIRRIAELFGVQIASQEAKPARNDAGLTL